MDRLVANGDSETSAELVSGDRRTDDAGVIVDDVDEGAVSVQVNDTGVKVAIEAGR